MLVAVTQQVNGSREPSGEALRGRRGGEDGGWATPGDVLDVLLMVLLRGTLDGRPLARVP